MTTATNEQLQQQMELAKQIQLLEGNLRSFLTKEALTRYYNIKAVNPEKAIQILALTTQLIQASQLKPPVTEEAFKKVLHSLEQQRAPAIHIRKY